MGGLSMSRARAFSSMDSAEVNRPLAANASASSRYAEPASSAEGSRALGCGGLVDAAPAGDALCSDARNRGGGTSRPVASAAAAAPTPSSQRFPLRYAIVRPAALRFTSASNSGTGTGVWAGVGYEPSFTGPAQAGSVVSASANAAMSGKRSSRSFCRARKMTRSRCSDTSGFTARGDRGTSRRCISTSSPRASDMKGRRPHTVSYRINPSAYMSLRGSISQPRSCSGDA